MRSFRKRNHKNRDAPQTEKLASRYLTAQSFACLYELPLYYVPLQAPGVRHGAQSRRDRYDRMVTSRDPSVPAEGGDLAADPLLLLRTLVNTMSAGENEDLLADRDDAAAWLRTARLLAADAGLSGSEHGALLRLRDSLRDVMAARAAGRQDAGAASRLTRALADGRLVVTLDPAGTSGLASSARASYSSLVAVLAIAVAQAFRE
jgi:hypothetical protein